MLESSQRVNGNLVSNDFDRKKYFQETQFSRVLLGKILGTWTITI